MMRSGGGGAAFHAKRRAYGPGASRWSLVPSGAGFLLVVGGVWVAVLVLFSTAFFVDNKQQQHASSSSSSSSSSWSFLSPSTKGSSSSGKAAPAAAAATAGSELRTLQSQVQGLKGRVDALREAQHARGPPLKAEAAAAGAGAGAGTAAKPKPEAEAKAAAANKGGPVATERGLFDHAPFRVKPQGDGDSSTSATPLVDPTVLTRSKPKFEHGDMESLCRKRNDGDAEVLDRVRVWDGGEMGTPRIMCISFTLKKYHDTAVENVRRTWGQKCDGYIAMSDFTDPEIPSVDIKHDGEEAYENMWQVCGWGCGGDGCACTRTRNAHTHHSIHTHKHTHTHKPQSYQNPHRRPHFTTENPGHLDVPAQAPPPRL